MKARFQIVLAAVVLTLAACADKVSTHGHVLRTASVDDVRPGVATKQDVRAVLGSPTSEAAFDPKVWYYITQVKVQQAFFKPDTAQQQVLVMHFDDRDVVERIGVLDEKDSEEVTLIARETPTAGHELTLLEQLLGNVGRFTRQEQQ